MRREVLAPLAVVAGLALAGLSAINWHDGSAGPAASAGRSPGSTQTPADSPGTLRVPALARRPDPRTPREQRQPQPREELHRPRLVPGAPQQLELPSIGVSAAVFPIGTAGSRTLVPPPDYTTVGWWSQGAEPGAGTGTTILAGHTVHTGGGALDNLGDVQTGDLVTLERANQDLRYRVTSVTTYRKGTLAQRAAEVFDQSGPERLAIVTCSNWNGEIYLSNVVVIASNPHPVAAER